MKLCILDNFLTRDSCFERFHQSAKITKWCFYEQRYCELEANGNRPQPGEKKWGRPNPVLGFTVVIMKYIFNINHIKWHNGYRPLFPSMLRFIACVILKVYYLYLHFTLLTNGSSRYFYSKNLAQGFISFYNISYRAYTVIKL